MNILDPQGPIGAAEKTILIDSVGIMLAIVVPTIIAIFAFAFWFRQSNPRATYMPAWAESGRIELVVWSIPTLTVILLGGVAWIGAHELDPGKPVEGTGQAITIQVVSLDWKWLFIYPAEGIATVNQLVVPTGTPLHFRLTSSGVMNSFFVPQLGSQIYTMAGMTSQLNLEADEPGDYHGLSAQFSGEGFADMAFNLRAVPARQYAQWIGETKGHGAALDNQAYAALAAPSKNTAPVTYKSVDPALFDAIVSETAEHGHALPGAAN